MSSVMFSGSPFLEADLFLNPTLCCYMDPDAGVNNLDPEIPDQALANVDMQVPINFFFTLCA